ncbi:MAG TPA: DUF4476 domain-containing protein [Flavobacterium sp.]|jgi:pantoate kinase
MKTTIMLAILLTQIGYTQSRPEGTKFPISETTITQNPVDSTVISAVTVRTVGFGNSNDVFSDDTGCKKEYAISAQEFAKALSQLRTEPSDEARLHAAFKFARKTCLNSTQISQLCKAFGLEKTKLEFAKFAYSACVDPNNYNKVSAVFAHAASKNDLTMYITGR